jgi:alginate O-acetyltransferase complex protein AlgI
LHGLYLAAERVLRSRFRNYTPGPLALVGLGLLTYALINITWVFFRAKTFTGAATMLRSMAGAAANPVPMLALLPMVFALVIVGGIVGTHWAMRGKTLEIAVERTPAWLVGAILALMAVAVVAEQGKGSAFIYFQF